MIVDPGEFLFGIARHGEERAIRSESQRVYLVCRDHWTSLILLDLLGRVSSKDCGFFFGGIGASASSMSMVSASSFSRIPRKLVMPLLVYFAPSGSLLASLSLNL